jgi:hypothetical protein
MPEEDSTPDPRIMITLRLVSSCAHGSACTRAQTVAAISAVGRFSSAGGVADLQAAIAAGVAAYRAGAVTR